MELVFAPLKNKKGQISIEFILIILFIVIYVGTTINPLVFSASTSTTETARVANAKIAAQKFTNIIDSLEVSQGEARITANIFIPEDSNVMINKTGYKVLFESKMDNIKNPKPCETTSETNCCYGKEMLVCRGEITLSTAPTIACPSNNGECKLYGKEMIQITAEKKGTGTVEITEIKYLPK